jgi:hypothetical protein
MSDTPSARRPEAQDALPDLDLIRDLTLGTRQMHLEAGRYVRKWSAEDPNVWAVRATCEQLYEGFSRIVSASVGMVFAKPPRWELGDAPGVADAFQPLLYAIDGAGTHASVFAKQVADLAIRDGYAVIVVDHPPTPPNATLADEMALALRPKWSLYERRAVLSWRVDTLANRETITQVVLHEPTTRPTGLFGVETVDRYRVLSLQNGVATYAVLTEDGKVEDAGVFTGRDGTPFTVLPVAVAYAGRKDAPFVCRPPLMGVAWANLGHYQLSTALRFYRELCAYPQPVVTGQLSPMPGSTGLEGGALALGPLVAVHLQAGATFDWKELAGTSLAQLSAGVTEKLEAMAAQGLSFLARAKRTTETAEARRLDATAENSTLATAAQGIEDALNVALGFTARYLGIDEAVAPTVALNRDYDATTLGAPELQAIAALATAGFPKATLLKVLQSGGIVDADADLLELAMDWEAGAGAARPDGDTFTIEGGQ